MTGLLRKVWFELWSNKSRTIQVVMVIALGAIGIGLVIGGRNLIAGTIADEWRLAQPPHIKLGVNPPLTPEQLRALERIDGVYQAEGLMNTSIEWRLAGETEWQTALLESRQDFSDQKMELAQTKSSNRSAFCAKPASRASASAVGLASRQPSSSCRRRRLHGRVIEGCSGARGRHVFTRTRSDAVQARVL